MEIANVARAEQYYKFVGEKNVEGVKNYLHPEVEFYGPLAALKGRDQVVEANRNFMKIFTSLTIRAKFAEGDQAVVVYDVDIPGIANNFPGASLLRFQEGKIMRIQLFYDASRFVRNKEEIFSKP